MKHTMILLTGFVAAAGLLFSGCQKDKPVSQPPAAEAPAPAADSAPAETTPAAEPAAVAQNKHATGKPLHITTEQELTDVLTDSSVTVVQFYADWCGPCRRLKPVIAKIAKDYTGKVAVAQVNVDKARPLAVKYGIQGIPDVRVFTKNGQIEKLVGLNPEQAYTSVLDKALAE